MRRRQDPKIKLTVYISRTVAGQLDLVCKDRTKNKSKLTETALAQLLSPQRDEEDAMPRRLDRLSRDVSLIHRHQQIVIESFGLFIRHYLMMSPSLPPSEHQAAQALGQQRFQRFIEQLGKRLASTASLASEIVEQVTSHVTRDKVDRVMANSGHPTEPDSTQPTAPDGRFKS